MSDLINFSKAFFEACPTGMLAFDQDSRICWLNPALEQMLHLDSAELIGKDKQTLPEGLHPLFDESDMLHISINGDGERWFRREIREINDSEPGPLRIHYYQDISNQISTQLERDVLKSQVEELTITDELTGLSNRKATLQALGVQVTRSRRYGNPLTLGIVEINIPNTPEEPVPEALILTFAHYLRDRLRWADTIGRYQSNLFMLVLPETSLADAGVLLEKIVQECHEGALSLPDKTPLPLIRYGLAHWEKGFDPQRLIDSAQQQLEETTS
ncbi:GGDEF domain-containing protein [endosymbiont of Riftia pachyptila]|uniref:diguanylate cyclase n=1 Tax=endosymbiont of Riftia pachyptila (vent Ph05) TaxID=1048808 RepID=G2D903_9GAMM|nr:diguanylate cyclase [endosymbiont of Riftia pachyptila]EGV52870.1 hypothetical protein Rifp1Sym_aa00280 [endosymbiont of Riftia pachyptila (vent Ph05)]